MILKSSGVSLFKINIKKLFSFEGSQRFNSNLASILKSNLISSIFPIVSMPIISRFYSPYDFGTFTLFTTILAIFSSFSTLRQEWSIPNTITTQETLALTLSGQIITLIFSFIFILLAFISPLFNELNQNPTLIFLLFLLINITCASQLLQSWYVRSGNLKVIAHGKIYQRLSNSVLGIGLGPLKLGSYGLIISNFISSIINLCVHFQKIKYTNIKLEKINFNYTKNIFLKYKNETFTSTLVAILNVLQQSTIPIILFKFYTVKDAGLYALASRIVLGPMSMLVSAISQSFWSETANLSKDNFLQIKQLYLKTTKKLIILSIFPVGICLIAPFFADYLLGKEKWQGAGDVLFFIAPQVFGIFVFGSTGHLVVYKKQKYQLISDLFIVCMGPFVAIIAKYFDLKFTTFIFMLSSSILSGYLLKFYFHLKANKVITEKQKLSNS